MVNTKVLIAKPSIIIKNLAITSTMVKEIMEIVMKKIVFKEKIKK